MVFASILLACCSEPTKIHLDVDGVDREAIVFAPSRRTSSKPPVLFAFHGHGGSPERMNDRAHFETLWPEAVVVYPQGLPTVIQDPTKGAPVQRRTAGLTLVFQGRARIPAGISARDDPLLLGFGQAFRPVG